MSAPNKKPKLSQRLTRAFFVGTSLGFVGFLIAYFFSVAINELANQQIFNPIALAVFSFAFLLASSIGVELSKDIEAQ